MVGNWFTNLPVQRKIALVVGFFSAVLVAMLALAIRDVRGAQARTEAMYREDLLPTGQLTVMRTSLLRALVLANNHLRAPDPAAAAAIEADMDKLDAGFDQAWERYRLTFRSELARTVGPSTMTSPWNSGGSAGRCCCPCPGRATWRGPAGRWRSRSTARTASSAHWAPSW